MKTAIWCYFPLSAGISPHGRYQPHGQWRHLEVDATGRDRVNGWLSVGYHVSGASRPGRVGHSALRPPAASAGIYCRARSPLLRAHRARPGTSPPGPGHRGPSGGVFLARAGLVFRTVGTSRILTKLWQFVRLWRRAYSLILGVRTSVASYVLHINRYASTG